MGFTKKQTFIIGWLMIISVTFSLIQFLNIISPESEWFKFKLLWGKDRSYLNLTITNPDKSRTNTVPTSISRSLHSSSEPALNAPAPSSRSTTSPAAKYVITYEEYGQLGNAMFQYAGTLGVAFMNDRIPLVNPRTQLSSAFKISHLMDQGIYKDWNVVSESSYARYDSKFEHLPVGNIRLQAYFQSYKYFEKCAVQVRKEFTFLDHIQAAARAILETVTKNFRDRKLIGVHVRRGDKLLFNDRSQGDQVASDTYFRKAFKWMREHHGNVLFLVTSDDVDWCKSTFQNEFDVILLPYAPREVHMCILSQCHHVIMSVGTFGWWAGWLGGGDVIYYKNQVLDGSPRSHLFNISDFAPPSWIGIGD
ncbi:Galactoside 2-alpha-L-fucosyltransferase 1 [Bulinus truncatus]|nr:Galactoside 2-alpha-L-fucosyltransferase 1 [Bulinus truncatus]